MIKITSDLLFSNPSCVPSQFQLYVCKFVQASEIKAALLKTPIDEKMVAEITHKTRDVILNSYEKNSAEYLKALSHISQCTVADMASIAQDYMIYISNEKKNLRTDEYIDLPLFSRFVKQSLEKDSNRSQFLQVINFEQIFNVFDLDKDGKLNFLEFMTSFAIMIEGNMLTKLKFVYVLYDPSQKGYLDSVTYDKFLNNIVTTAVIYNNGKYQAFFNDDCDRFFQSFKHHASIKTPEKVKFVDIGESLSKSPFIIAKCREKKKKNSVMRSRSSISNEDPFNLGELAQKFKDDSAVPDRPPTFDEIPIEEIKEEQEASVNTSSSSSLSDDEDQEEEKDIEPPTMDQPEETEETETSEKEVEDMKVRNTESNEKGNIYVEHLEAKKTISAWADREKAALEEKNRRISENQRIVRSRTSIVERPPVAQIYENSIAPMPNDEPDEKPNMNFPWRENINVNTQVKTGTTKISKKPALPQISGHEPVPLDHIETPEPRDPISGWIDLFTKKRDSHLTPQGPVEKMEQTPQATIARTKTIYESPTNEEPNDFLNEAALTRATEGLSDAEKEVARKRQAQAAKDSQGGACKVCNIF